MAEDIFNNPDYVYNEYQQPEIPDFIAATSGGGTPVVSIAGATGPSVVFGGSTGLIFSGAGATVIVSGVLVAANGGTGQSSYTVGDILFASGAAALSKLTDVATGNALISGGVATAPSWGKIGLTTHVSGILPNANGGMVKINSATVAPTASDDSGAGYSVNSLWTDTVLDDAYICVDDTLTAAVWKKITP